MGLGDLLVKVSWLGKLASVFWWVELDSFSLQCYWVSSSEFWDGSIGLVWIWAACILTLRAIFLCGWWICVVCFVLELIGSWVVVGFSVVMEAGSLKNQESSRKISISALLTMPKPSTVWITINCGKFWKRWEYQTTWPASWETCLQVRKQLLELDMEQQTGCK